MKNKKDSVSRERPSAPASGAHEGDVLAETLDTSPLCPRPYCTGDDEHLAGVTAWTEVIRPEHTAGSSAREVLSHRRLLPLLLFITRLHQNVAKEKKNKNCIKWKFDTCQLGRP